MGFLIVYVTSRLDFQKTKVMSWLAEHNFPYGLVSFGNGITKDLQKHKTEFLRYLVNDVSYLCFKKEKADTKRISVLLLLCSFAESSDACISNSQSN